LKPSPSSRISGVAAAFALFASPLAAHSSTFSGTSTEPAKASVGLELLWPSAPAPFLLMIAGTVLVALVIGRRASARRTAEQS